MGDWICRIGGFLGYAVEIAAVLVLARGLLRRHGTKHRDHDHADV